MNWNLKLPKQHYLGNLPGRCIFLYASAATLFGIIGLIMNASTWFMVATSYFGLSLSIWLLYTSLLIGIPTVVLLYWVFITPSQMSVGNEQACKHQNPVISKLDELLVRIGKIEERMK